MAERKEKFAVRILDEQKKAVTKEFNRKEIEEIISKFLSNTLFTFPGIANICNTTDCKSGIFFSSSVSMTTRLLLKSTTSSP